MIQTDQEEIESYLAKVLLDVERTLNLCGLMIINYGNLPAIPIS